MLCPNCGADIPNGSKFCPKCGAKLNVTEGKNTYETFNQIKTSQEKIQTQSYVQNDNVDERTIYKYHLQMIIGIIVAVVVAIGVVILIIVVLNSSVTTIDLNNYLIITTEGYDGNGTASYYIDEQQLLKDYGDKIQRSTNDAGMRLAGLEGDYLTREFFHCISGSFDKSSGLSNGEEITFRWEIDTSTMAGFDVKLKYSDVERTVIGLK